MVRDSVAEVKALCEAKRLGEEQAASELAAAKAAVALSFAPVIEFGAQICDGIEGFDLDIGKDRTSIRLQYRKDRWLRIGDYAMAGLHRLYGAGVVTKNTIKPLIP